MKRFLARLALFLMSTLEITTGLFLAFMLYKTIDLNDGGIFWYGFVAGLIFFWIGMQVIFHFDGPRRFSEKAKKEVGL